MKTKEFHTYEELFEYLEKETGFKPPKLLEGRMRFLESFNTWFFNNETSKIERNWICIFPDPSLSLTYPYPIDEISIIAKLCDFKFPPTCSSSQEFLNSFHLYAEISNRQTLTLSGGELLLLNFAKATISEKLTKTIYICTPTQWLHKTKYSFLNNLIKTYHSNNKNVNLLLLEGEKEVLQKPQVNILKLVDNTNSLPWSLKLNCLKVIFEEQFFPKEISKKTLQYIPKKLEIELTSPTLIIGDNGVGKSVFVKVLSGIIKEYTGKVNVRCLGNDGYARILLQNGVYQLFGESIEEHFIRVFKYDTQKGEEAKSLYLEMINLLKEEVRNSKKLRKLKLLSSNSDSSETILQIKLALVAERIISYPPLLVLDEPDWGLSKSLTKIFLKIIINQAHKYNIPVLIISHLEEWYRENTNSILSFSKKGNKIKIKEIR